MGDDRPLSGATHPPASAGGVGEGQVSPEAGVAHGRTYTQTQVHAHKHTLWSTLAHDGFSHLETAHSGAGAATWSWVEQLEDR